MKTEKSKVAFEAAKLCIPGGVNSPVRNFSGTGLLYPLFIAKGAGARVWDIDGNEYIDYVQSWGASILGHAHPEIVKAVNDAASRGLSFGAPTEKETELAELILEAIPSMEQIRFVNSGTEAVMSAIRLARAATGRSLIVKFEGCYHGHADSLLVKAGSGVLEQAEATSAGVPDEFLTQTLVVPYNDLEAVKRVFAQRGKEIACIIVEPAAANMGLVLPQEGFLEGLRKITKSVGALLIFDEVITGFRVGWRGAQGRFGVIPDITCLGKIIGGGLPMGAYGAAEGIMSHVAPLGRMYQAGTLSGNPVAVSAGLSTLRQLKDNSGVYQQLEEACGVLTERVLSAARKAGVPCQVTYLGGLFSIFWTKEEIKDLASVQTADVKLFKKLFARLLEKGIYIAPSPFEAGFITVAHNKSDIERTGAVFAEALR